MGGYRYNPETGGLDWRDHPRNPLAKTPEELEADAAEFARGWSIEPNVLFTENQDQDDDDFAKGIEPQHHKHARCPRCGHGEYGLIPPDFETARCMKCNGTFPVLRPQPPEFIGERLTKAAEVQAPGSRGGTFFVDPKGMIRYGAQPARRERRPAQVKAQHRARKQERAAAAAERGAPAAPRNPAPKGGEDRARLQHAVGAFKQHYERLRLRAMKLVAAATTPKVTLFRTALKVGHTWARFEHYCRKRGLEAEELVLHAFIEMPHLAHLALSVLEPAKAAAEMLLKSEQLDLFGQRKVVQAPGSRGGRWRFDRAFNIRYDQPAPTMPPGWVEVEGRWYPPPKRDIAASDVPAQSAPATPAEKTEQAVAASAEHVPTPDLKRAAKFRQLAESMQESIDRHRHPGVANQNVTARRARIAGGMYAEADRLERIQSVMMALADLAERGAMPPELANISHRKDVEVILQGRWGGPGLRAQREGLRQLLDGEAKRGQKADRETIRRALLSEGAWINRSCGQCDGTGKLDGGSTCRLCDGAGRTTGRNENLLDLTDEQWDAAGRLFDPATHRHSYLPDDLAGRRLAKRLGYRTDADFERTRALLRGMMKEVGRSPREQQIYQKESALIGAKIPGYFPTPDALSDRLVAAAALAPGMRILEPSAGKGNLVEALRRAGVTDEQLDVGEYSSSLRDILELKGCKLVSADFLEYNPGPVYDRIIQNPPFEDGADVAHVLHAYELLKPGGRLVSIMGEHAFFASDRRSAEFRAWLDEHGSEGEKLPEKSFMSSTRPTGVNARIVVIDKPAATVLAKGVEDALFAKAVEQLTLFGERKPVQRPGIRGGKWYLDRHFQVRYGEPPHGVRTFGSEAEAQAAHTAGPTDQREELAHMRGEWAVEGQAADAPPPADVPPDRPPSGGDDGDGDDDKGEPEAEPLWLGPDGIAWLEARIGELAKRARRLKIVEPSFEVIATELRREAVQTRDGRDQGKSYWLPPGAEPGRNVRLTGAVREYKQVAIHNPEVKLEGWTFLGKIEHDGEPGEPDIVSPVPGKAVPIEYRTRGNICDHCQVQRRRSETFVLQHEDGRTRQVGRTCLADFLGHADAERLANAAAIYGDLGELIAAAKERDDDADYGGDRGEVLADTDTFLSYVALAVRLHGFVSKKQANDYALAAEGRRTLTATADAALDLMFPPKKERGNPNWPRPEDRDREKAALWRAWAAQLPDEEVQRSDYLYNLNTLAKRDAIRPLRHSGLLASISAAYDRAMGVERERTAAKEQSEFVGEVGARMLLRDLTIDKIITKEGIYGTTYIHKLHDAAGNQFTWFASKTLRVIDTAPDSRNWSYWLKPGWVEERSPTGNIDAVVEPDGTRHVLPPRPADWYTATPEVKQAFADAVAAFEEKAKEGRLYTRDADEGDTVPAVKATIKNHEVYRDVKQTVITRVAEVEPVELEKLAAKEAKAAAKAAKAAAKAAKQGGGEIAKASWGARIMAFARKLLTKAATPAAAHRYVTVHKGGPETPGETIRMTADPYTPGTFDVHEEDRERASAAFRPDPAAASASKPGAGKPSAGKGTGFETPEDRRKKRARLIAKLVEELVVGENGAITPKRGGA